MYSVALIAETRVAPDQYEAAHAHLADVLDHLAELEATDSLISDTDLSVNLRECRIEIGMLVHVESADEALAIAKSAIRAAIHAAGGFTLGWEEAQWSLTIDAGDQQDLLASC